MKHIIVTGGLGFIGFNLLYIYKIVFKYIFIIFI